MRVNVYLLVIFVTFFVALALFLLARARSKNR